MNIVRFAAIMITSALIFTCGCATMPDSGSLSDEDIADEVRNRLEEDSVSRLYSFGVTVENGVVTIQGSVPAQDALRARIVSVAASAPGVERVEEDLYPPMIGPY